MFKFHVQLGIVFLAILIIGNIVAYFYLPEDLVMQINSSGTAGFTLPKLIGQGLLVLFGGAVGFQVVMKKTQTDFKRWFLIMAVMLLVNVLVLIFNLQEI